MAGPWLAGSPPKVPNTPPLTPPLFGFFLFSASTFLPLGPSGLFFARAPISRPSQGFCIGMPQAPCLSALCLPFVDQERTVALDRSLFFSLPLAQLAYPEVFFFSYIDVAPDEASTLWVFLFSKTLFVWPFHGFTTRPPDENVRWRILTFPPLFSAFYFRCSHGHFFFGPVFLDIRFSTQAHGSLARFHCVGGFPPPVVVFSFFF